MVAVSPSTGFVAVKPNVNVTSRSLRLSKEPATVLNNGVGGMVFAGGLMGYVKAKSKASLIAGSTFGGLLLVAAHFVSSSGQGKKKFGAALGSTVAGLLTYTMGKKFLKSGKFVPAGLIAGFGALSCIVNIVEWIMATGPSGPVEF